MLNVQAKEVPPPPKKKKSATKEKKQQGGGLDIADYLTLGNFITLYLIWSVFDKLFIVYGNFLINIYLTPNILSIKKRHDWHVFT